tara:strand:+ start:5385 stop:5627 length:243 start_codon:yes stop_codon:yes gene_type:complete
MAYTKQEWIQEYEHLKRFMNDEGMSVQIGMPFTLMLSLLESAKNYMECGTKKPEEVYTTNNRRLKAAQDYLDWKRAHNED